MGGCHKCGAEIPKGGTTCPDCGTPVEGDTTGVNGGNGETDRSHSERDGTTEQRRADPPTTASESGETTTEGDGSTEGSALEGRFWINTIISATIGFVLAILLSVEFFPIYFLGIMAGGFVGGLFHRSGVGSGAMVGGMSGFLATVPFVGILVVLAVAGGAVAAMDPVVVEVLQQEEVLATVVAISVLLVGVSFLANIVFGLLGGLVGGAVAGA